MVVHSVIQQQASTFFGADTPIVGFATAKVLLFYELHNKNVYNFVFAYKMGIFRLLDLLIEACQ